MKDFICNISKGCRFINIFCLKQVKLHTDLQETKFQI